MVSQLMRSIIIWIKVDDNIDTNFVVISRNAGLMARLSKKFDLFRSYRLYCFALVRQPIMSSGPFY